MAQPKVRELAGGVVAGAVSAARAAANFGDEDTVAPEHRVSARGFRGRKRVYMVMDAWAGTDLVSRVTRMGSLRESSGATPEEAAQRERSANSTRGKLRVCCGRFCSLLRTCTRVTSVTEMFVQSVVFALMDLDEAGNAAVGRDVVKLVNFGWAGPAPPRPRAAAASCTRRRDGGRTTLPRRC